MCVARLMPARRVDRSARALGTTDARDAVVRYRRRRARRRECARRGAGGGGGATWFDGGGLSVDGSDFAEKFPVKSCWRTGRHPFAAYQVGGGSRVRRGGGRGASWGCVAGVRAAPSSTRAQHASPSSIPPLLPADGRAVGRDARVRAPGRRARRRADAGSR